MRTTLLQTALFLCFYLLSGVLLYSQECDCPGDFNYTSYYNYSDFIGVLTNMVCEPELGCHDINEDGVFNPYDMFTFLDRLGHSCEGYVTEQTESSFQGIHLVEWTEYPDSLIGFVDGLPLTTKVYRLYAEFSDQGENIAGVYGNDAYPIEINHSASFYKSPVIQSITAENITAFYDLLPELHVRSYFTVGYTEPNAPNSSSYISRTGDYCSTENGFDVLFETENTPMYSDNGLSWFWNEINPPASIDLNSNFKLLAQFTTTGEISGNINIASRFHQGPYDQQPSHFHEGLAFSSDDLSTFGCTDPEAINFDPEADLNEGCIYFLGDLNGDNEVGFADLTVLLSGFGCSFDCGNSDLNGDGVVNLADLIILLGLL